MKKQNQDRKSSASDKLAALIGISIARLQARMLSRLSAWESRQTTRQKKMYLILFCGISGGYFLYVLLTAALLPAPADSMLPLKPIQQLNLPPPFARDSITDSFSTPK